MVVLDGTGAVLRPAKLWNDTESAADAAALVEALPGGAAAWAEACGSVPVASFTITKLRWLRRCEPEVYDQVARGAAAPRLADRPAHRRPPTTDRGDASGHGLVVAGRGPLPARPAGARRR